MTDVEIAIGPDGATVHIVAIVIKEDGIKYLYYARNTIPNNFTSWVISQLTSYVYDVESISVSVSSDGVTHICFTGNNTPLFITHGLRGERLRFPRVLMEKIRCHRV